MMKRFVPCLLLMLYSCIGYTNLSEYDETKDGELSIDEYVDSPWLEGDEVLIVNGGDATTVDLWNDSRLVVKATTSFPNDPFPLDYENGYGVYDIHMHDSSTLLFEGGATESITIKTNATAELRGGLINHLTIYNFGSMTSSATIYCLPGYTRNASGISGVWGDGITTFYIQFDNPGGVFPATYNFVNIVEVPEPATLALLGLGGLLIRQKK